jgi:hypothetical protein
VARERGADQGRRAVAQHLGEVAVEMAGVLVEQGFT